MPGIMRDQPDFSLEHFFFFSSRRRHTRLQGDWSSDVCSSDLSLTTEYAVVFGGEMGFSISSEVDRTLEREGHERRDQARRLFRDFMNGHGVPKIGRASCRERV